MRIDSRTRGNSDSSGETDGSNGSDQVKDDNIYPRNNPDCGGNYTGQVKTSNEVLCPTSFELKPVPNFTSSKYEKR